MGRRRQVVRASVVSLVELKHEVGDGTWCSAEIETCAICRENYEIFIDEQIWEKKPNRRKRNAVLRNAR